MNHNSTISKPKTQQNQSFEKLKKSSHKIFTKFKHNKDASRYNQNRIT